MLMITLIRRWLATPKFEDEDKTRIAGLLSIILYSTIPIVLFRGIVVLLSSPESPKGIWIIGVVLVIQVSLVFVVRRGWVRSAAAFFCLIIWIAISFAVYQGGGISNPNFAALGMVIMLAGLLLGAGAAIISGIVVILTGIGLAYLTSANLLPAVAAPITLGYTSVAYSANFTMMAVLLAIVAYSIQQSLQKARQSSKSLSERNRELQDQIAERKLAEEALRQSEERFSKAFNANLAPLSISTLDNGRFIDVNHSMAALLGYEREELLGNSSVELRTWAVPSQRDEAIATLQKQGTVNQQEVQFRRKSGDICHTLMSLEIIELKGEHYLLGLLLDITERKQAELQRLELAVAQEKMSLLAEVIGNLSHDLKTPLSVIETSLYLIERITDPEKQKDKIEVIRTQTQYLGKIIQDILTITRLDHVPQLELKPIDLNQMVHTTEQIIQPSVETKNLQISLDLSPSVPPVWADKDELNRAVINLVENAVKYTPEGGAIAIRTYQEQQQVVMEIKDTGIGISHEELPHIFDRFYRASSARTSTIAGTGLGLAITKKIIDMLGGSIEVESALGQGTLFRIHLSTDTLPVIDSAPTP